MTNHKNMLDREAVRSVIQQWNANRLDLFALSEPDENLLFHGVMRFYFQDAGQKVATKCIRVASDATVADVIDTLIEKFRPDMRMLSVPNYALYEVHANGEERKLNRDEKPLLVQFNWHIDDREGRFLLKNIDQKTTPIESTDTQFKRKLSKREKKENKKKDKLLKQNCELARNTENETQVAGKLYSELPETSFTRSISNPEAVMRRRRQQKLEKKLQKFRSKDGGPDTGGTLKIYGESLCQDVPYKTLLLSIRDCAQAVVREMLSKYGLDKTDPLHYCLVQVNSDDTEYILDDDECPLSILMNHPTSRGSIMFHVRRRPADSQPRRRKKKPLGASNGGSNTSGEGPVLVEVTHSGDSGRRIKLGSDPIEVGSASTNSLQLFGPSIQPRHCLISLSEGVCTVTPLHVDALTFVNGHHVTQPTILHNGSVVMIGRVGSFRFIDSPSGGRFNLALSQSQLDSASLYESRSPTLPPSLNYEYGNTTASKAGESERSSNSNQINSGMASRSAQEQHEAHAKEMDLNYEVTEQSLDSETKSISSLKSAESHNHDQRSQNKVSWLENQGQELILPAVLEFPETHQEQFLSQIISELDVNLPHFKLAPVYSLYLCARYRASTHYRPELQPTERAHKLTIFLHHVANLIYSIIQGQYTDPRILAFWMSNSSEFLHFLKSDRHISAFSIQAQEILAESVQTAFQNLVNCFRVELSQTLNQFLSETIDHDSAAGLVLTVLGSAMALLRRCRVNAALTIQLFSQLFHYINVMCFNTIVANSHMCTGEWGKMLTERLKLLELWAERQGLELAADCHLAKINQCAQFLQAPKTSVEEIQKLTCSCFRLNSLQMAALLQQEDIPRNLIDTVIRMAESVADELTRADGREVRLEESPELHLALLLPDDGFSCDVVRGIPSGLLDFLDPLQSAGFCRLAAQPTSIGLWTVYMNQFNARSPSEMSNKLPQPEVQVIKLQKNSNGMGLSIVAAKGAGQEKLGIYIKSVVPGGAADADNRLQAGDQLLRVDGQSLIGITQERAADYLVRTGPVVTLEVAKQGAIYHGLPALLQQASPLAHRVSRSQKDISMIPGIEHAMNPGRVPCKSLPTFHHPSKNFPNLSSNPQLAQSLSNSNEQSFYQNVSGFKPEHHNQTVFEERHPPSDASTRSSLTGTFSKSIQQLTLPHNMQQHNLSHQAMMNQSNHLNRSTSAYFQGNAYGNYTDNPSHAPKQPSNQMLMSSDSLRKSDSSLNMNANKNPNPQQSNTQQHHQQPQPSLNAGNRPKNAQHFSREGQAKNSLRMNQMLAPSMPNIADARTTTLSPNIYNNGMLSSQSMQNVAMINQAMNLGDNQQQQQHSFTNTVQSQSQQQLAPKPPGHKHNLSAFTVASSKQYHPLSIPTAQPFRPPQYNKKPPSTEETPPLPPSTTHPLFKGNPQTSQGVNSVPNSMKLQKGGYYPIKTLPHPGSFAAPNPWEREEQQKEREMRREHIRHWRDKQIANLSNLSQRTPQQEEQLKTLVLEREFERRAHEVVEQEEDSEPPMDKENEEEERFRGQQSTIKATNPNFSQMNTEDEQNTAKDMPVNVAKNENQPSMVIQPKGILKNNRGDASNASLKTLPLKTNKNITDVRKNDSNINSNIEMNSKELISRDHLSQPSSNILPNLAASPPSPPERNISYIVMSQKQQSINNNNSLFMKSIPPTNPNDTQSMANLNAHNNLLVLGRDNKRVSFHDEENNYVQSPESTNELNYSIDKLDLHTMYKPPSDLSGMSNEMMQSPQTPEADVWNLTVKSTPGVIGAQEVYRDPRQRRLAEQQEKEQQRSSDAVPEKLSFKEKMKMFALESGEDQTPKDKLKISRAQRDIDAAN